MFHHSLWISLICLAISPLFTLMMFLFTINIMVLLSLLRKSNYFKQRFISLAMIFLRDKFVPSIKQSNLLTNPLMSLLTKHNCKDSLGLLTTLLSFIRVWGNNVNHSLIGYRTILLLGLISTLLLLNRSSLILKL